jgi:hypothetical protein
MSPGQGEGKVVGIDPDRLRSFAAAAHLPRRQAAFRESARAEISLDRKAKSG